MAASPKARQLLDHFATELRRTLTTPRPDQVHNLRVAIRKFTQALTIFERESKETDAVRRGLKRVMALAGDVRDCDITIDLVRKAGAPPKFIARLRRRRSTAQHALLTELQNLKEAGAPANWHDKLGEARRSVVEKDVILHAVKRLFKRGTAAARSDKQLHPLRIAAKKLRYTLDLLERSDPAHLDQLKELQKKLGEINDYETAHVLAGDESASKRIITRLRNKQDKKVKTFHRYWEKEFSGRKRKWKRATLRQAK